MGSRADGDSNVPERLTVLVHSLGTMESVRPNGSGRRVVRSTLDPEEGWGCGWTPQKTHDTSLSASKMEISGGNSLLIGRCPSLGRLLLSSHSSGAACHFGLES